MSATVEKIVLKVGDKKIELSVEDAKDLHKILGDLVGDKIVINSPLPCPCPSPSPWIYPVYTKPWDNWEITWEDSGDTASITYTNS